LKKGILVTSAHEKPEKEPKTHKMANLPVDKDLERLKKNWSSRKGELKDELVDLQKIDAHKQTVRDLLNLIKALEVREKILDARETTMYEKECSIETQKQRLSQQAEKLAQLRGQLELKISELEKRLATLENVE
jgi:vacuolar-type H+-ATPase subunit I/STV1